MQGINITPSPKKTTPKKSTPLSTRSSASSSAPIPNVAPPVPPPAIPPEPTPAPKPKAPPKPKAKPVPPPEPVKQVGIEIINNNTKSFWKDQNIATLKLQCELRGKRFTDAETKGTTRYVNGKKLKVKRMMKNDYLIALYKLLNI